MVDDDDLTAAVTPSFQTDAGRPAAQGSIGRYQLGERLGVGGVGTVCRAFDPVLKREVAIKRLNTRGSAVDRARMVREARAMAQLSHPHVARVFDVGIDDDGDVFIAMELVEGSDLKRWLRARARPWRDVLAVFVDAGRGLEAAHVAGMVHRDFKPANVLLSRAGEVRVTDFGIARPTSEGASESNSADLSALSSSVSGAQTYTATGLVLGTPAYMAPEHLYGGEVDARADQFAFCVSLWEALWGERPFSADSYRELAESKAAGAVRAPRDRGRVPASIETALRTGLRTDPSQRFAAMDDLLQALQRARGSTARRASRMAMAGVVLVGVGALWAPRAGAPTCEQTARAANAAYSPTARAGVMAAFGEIDLPYAATSRERVDEVLGAYAAELLDARLAACAAPASTNAEDDGRTDCLESRSRALRATVATLSSVDAETLGRAVPLAQALPAVADCLDRTAVDETRTPNDAALASAVGLARERLAHGVALHRAGRFAAADTVLSEMVDRANALGYGPLQSQARAAAAAVELSLGRIEAATADGQVAYSLATEHELDATAVRDAVTMAKLEATADPGAAGVDRWLAYAGAAARRHGRDDLQARVDLATAEVGNERGDSAAARTAAEAALAWSGAGDTASKSQMRRRALNELGLACARGADFDCAQTSLERSIRIHEEELGIDHPELATLHNNYATLMVRLGRLEDGRRHFEEAIALTGRAHGARHAAVGTVTGNYAVLLGNLGQTDDALEVLDRADVITALHYGPEHPRRWEALEQRGSILSWGGRYDEALAVLEAVVDGYERNCPDDAHRMASVLNNIGVVHHFEERFDRALEFYARSLEFRRLEFGEMHADNARAHANIGMVQTELGQLDEAVDSFRAAIEIYTQLVSPDHVELLSTRQAMADALRALGRDGDAVEILENVIRKTPDGALPWDVAQYHLALAKALWARPQQRARAERELQTAQEAVLGSDLPGAVRMVAEIDDWVATRES